MGQAPEGACGGRPSGAHLRDRGPVSAGGVKSMRSVGRWVSSLVYSGMFCSMVLSPWWILVVLFPLLLLPIAVAVTLLAVLWFKPRLDALHDVDAILKKECPSARDLLWFRGGLSWYFLGVFPSMAVAAVQLGLFLILLSFESQELLAALMGMGLLALGAGVAWLTRRESRTAALVALSSYAKSRRTDRGLLQQAADAVSQPIRDLEAARLASASS